MKYTYRKVRNTSGNTGIQVGYYSKGNFKVTNHLGTARDAIELATLVREASTAVVQLNGDEKQLRLFRGKTKDLQKEFQKKYHVTKVTHMYAYSELSKYLQKIGYGEIKQKLLKDLALIRVIKPVSKRESLKLLKEYFSISYSESGLYKQFGKFQSFKKQIQKISTNFAVTTLKQDINILLYDVTTLYFETFNSDELRSLGFSKDNKFSQPQLVIGLVTTDIGFPVTYHMYQGKKFEGHTMIPTMQSYLDAVNVGKITVVADAGMLSSKNILAIESKLWNYIVGARLSNLKQEYFKKIKGHDFQKESKLEINSSLGRLIVAYADKRYRKDKYELGKSIKKAEKLLNTPSKITSRYKYISKTTQEKFSLNTDLIQKREVLLGLKGYYTNTKYSAEKVISEYSKLWRIEQNFRVLKSDLACRPIYHWKPANIQGHLLISFLALSISKYIEIDTGESIRSFVKKIMKIHNLEVQDLESDQTFSIQL